MDSWCSKLEMVRVKVPEGLVYKTLLDSIYLNKVIYLF